MSVGLAERWRRSLRCPRCQGGLEWETTAVRCRECDNAYDRDGDLVALIPPEAAPAEHTAFYNDVDEARYGRDAEAMDPNAERWVREYLAALPGDRLVVEIGAGRGAFNGAHPGMVSLDISRTALRTFCVGPRVQADAQVLPFASRSLDAVFSVFSLEHVPAPERALDEIDRCLAPGGTALLYPAWLVRPWAAKALDRRPMSELGTSDRLRKLTIPVRNAKPFVFGKILPGRIARERRLARGHRLPLAYRPLVPNLDEFLAPDSDAFSSIDPQAMSAYFLSRGYEDLRRAGAISRILYMYEPVHVRKAT
jgi:SAM-dependent methyltransferase